ncbi:MAG: ATP-grasp fold amidoligase family protein [Pseudomonadota bacterium]
MARAILDRLIFLCVDLYLVLRHPFEARKLAVRSWSAGHLNLSIAAPRSANAAFTWRKLMDRDPRWTVLSDKLAAKHFIAALGVAARLPATLWEGRAQDVPARYLGADVVIKSNHGSGTSLFPARDGLAPEAVRRGIARAAAQNHGRAAHEWGYFDIVRKIFVEEHLASRGPLMELKIYTYGPRVLRVVQIRSEPGRPRIGSAWFYDETGTLVRSDQPTAISKVIDRGPLASQVPEALDIAARLGSYFDHLRVDFIVADEGLYLGELTVYSQAGWLVGGYAPASGPSLCWDIRRSWFLRTPQRGWKGIYARALARHCARRAATRPGVVAEEAGFGERFRRSLDIAQRLLAKG